MKPTLLVLAAGMGSRYGSLKQLDGLGPHGETIMDYSVFDAMRSGFGKVVFVIRRSFEKEFREKILSKYEGHIPVEVVFQEIDCLPDGFEVPEGRTRPWGTNHAVMMGQSVVNEPFAVINSDDFYGLEAYRRLSEFLSALPEGAEGRYAMVAFNVGNTTTPNGEVSRGVCTVDDSGRLHKIVERHHIGYDEEGLIRYKDENDNWCHIDATAPVSMNFWGFTPEYFRYSRYEFRRFLKKYIERNREFFIPSVVDVLIGCRLATVDVLGTDSQWFGVTYSDDREGVRRRLAELHRQGVYPDNLFDISVSAD